MTADRAALARSPAAPVPLPARRAPPPPGGEAARVAARRSRLGHGAEAPPIVHEALRSPGEPLPGRLRHELEGAFGVGLGGVSVLTGELADRSAHAVDARAYTVGSRLVFARGAYAPEAGEGRRLIAHELAHVVQQQGVRSDGPLRIDAGGEADAERAADDVAAGRSVRGLGAAAAAVQRQEVVFPPEFDPIPLVPSLIPELVEAEIEVEIGEAIEIGQPFEIGEPLETAEPVVEPVAEPVAEPDVEVAKPETEVPPETGPKLDPLPPVGPKPDVETETEEKKKEECGTGPGQLPPTFVTWSLGPKGQAGTVTACPLTKCPGNTKGSQGVEGPYQAQFDCIRAAGKRRTWYPMHMLHGWTRRSLDKNMHGPGNTRWNIIIGDVGVNSQANVSAERPALAQIYGASKALWYEAKMIDYFPPDNDYFAKKISIEWGFYDVVDKKRGPTVFSDEFESEQTPPNCATTLPIALPPAAPAATPATPGATGFTSTLKICKEGLASRVFTVANGGLKVTIGADWLGAGVACAAGDYTVSLVEQNLLSGLTSRLDSGISTTTVPAGKNVTLTWRYLENGSYYLLIGVPGHDPSCCLVGGVSSFEFDAPRPPPRVAVPPGQTA